MFRSRKWAWLIILIVFAFGLWRVLQPGPPTYTCDFNDRIDPTELVYVEHASCRMECRESSQRWVERVYAQGRVNCRKSGPKDGDMRYALEMEDDRGDRLRIIVEVEGSEHIVITVIRLGGRDKCACS